MVRRITVYPEPILLQPTREVESVGQEVRTVARDMAETMYENKGIGLAAPQINLDLKVITVDTSGPDKRQSLITLINPCILSREGQVENEEACLSLPYFSGKIQRSEKIVVQGLNIEGQEESFEAKGLDSICLQHEIDHLHGVLLLDHVSRLKRNLYEKKIRKWFKKSATTHSE
ncbi:MAG TPA: peptide deformylase [Desulfohalobiaceae bacterium]|nr:peptide deformylase [Desulfohalobiaceae bacterium]